MKKKKGIISIIIALLVGGGGYVAYDNFGAGFVDNNITLIGSSSNLKSLPLEQSFTDSTTTNDVAHSDSGGTLIQLVTTPGIRKVILNIEAIGGTVTSTMYIRQQGSFDGTNYFNIATSTAPITSATSTSIGIVPRGTNLDPGLNTSTISLIFPVDGYRFTRFIIHADNIATDPNDGVQAWITATLIEDIVR